MLDDFHRLSSAADARERRLVRRPPAGDGPARALHPHRPGAAARHAARPRPAARAARGRAALHAARRRRSSSTAGSGSTSTRGDVELLVARTEGWPAGHLPGGAVARGHGGQGTRWWRAFDGTSAHVVDFLAERGARRLRAGAAGVHAAHVGARAAVRAAVRRRARRARRRPARSTRSRARTCSCCRSTIAAGGSASTTCSPRSCAWSSSGASPALVAGAAPARVRVARAFGTTDEAIHHAVAAGAFAEAGALIAETWVHYANAGRIASVARLAARDSRGGARRRPAAAARARRGSRRCAAARPRCARAAARVRALGGLDDGPLPDGFVSLESSLSVLRGDVRLGRRVGDPRPRRALGGARGPGLAVAAGDHVGARLGALLQRRPRPGRALADARRPRSPRRPSSGSSASPRSPTCR